jgi:hypothetical protein
MAFAQLVRFGPLEVLFALAMVAAGVTADQRVRREDVFLANMGIAPWAGPALSVTAAAVLETAAGVVTGGLL